MTSHLKLLPLLLGSGLVMAQEQVQLTHPGQISLDLQRQHLTERLHQAQHQPQTKITVQQPRIMSPAEFEKVQAKIDADKRGIALSSKWQPESDRAFLQADNLKNGKYALQSTNATSSALAAGCNSPAD